MSEISVGAPDRTAGGHVDEAGALSRGQVGMLLLIASEIALFGSLVSSYLFYAGRSLAGPYPQDVLRIPIVNTVCLLSSSGTIAVAVRALRRGQRRRFLGWWLVTIGLGLEFLVGTGREWYELIVHDGLTIATNLFGTNFFTLVGFHALHVTVGIVLLSLVAGWGAAGSLRAEHVERVEILSWYWHFVDTVWVVVFTVVYLVGR